MPQKTAKAKEITGIISVTRRCVGYVTREGEEHDIEIAPERLNTALHGDTVEVRLLPKRPNVRVQGEITHVISRRKTEFVGVLEKAAGGYLLHADDKRMHRDITVATHALADMRVPKNAKVLIRLLPWSDPKKDPEGELLEVIGTAGEHDTEMRAIVRSKGFDTTFPEDIEREAAAIGARRDIADDEIQKRRDFRNTTTFTIDPEDAKDFDDALSIKRLENGNVEVGIHIADVSHYVRPGSAIDKEAQERGTSIYLVDRTIPMLPEVLSNDVCSLNPGEDKLAYSAVFELDAQARVINKWIGSTVIHSDKRFTYEEAQQVLDQNNGSFADELQMLNKLAVKLRAQREKEGAISFEQDEVSFELDANGKPISIQRKERIDTNMLIEDFMLLANREVAAHMHRLCKERGLREATFVYRVHDVPDADKLEDLAIFLRAIGYDFEITNGEVTGQEINQLFAQIEGKPEEHLIKTATIRSMAKAVYSTKNIGHFGLAFQYYTHFTSPIRRYPDVMVHRIMKSFLARGEKDNQKDQLSKEQFKLYERLTIQSSQREIAAVEAERDSIKYKQVEFMQSKVGQTFTGTVVGVVEWGLYIEEKETKAEGLLRIKNLGDDYYEYHQKKYRLTGQKSNRSYALGDIVKVKLVDANLEERTLEWKLADEPKKK